MRANAALRLASFAETLKPGLRSREAPVSVARYPYFLPVASQVTTALHLEPNPAVRRALGEALSQIIDFAAQPGDNELLTELIHKIADANRAAKTAFIRAMAEYSVREERKPALEPIPSLVTQRTTRTGTLDLDLVADLAPFCFHKDTTKRCLIALMKEGEERDEDGEVTTRSAFNVFQSVHRAKRLAMTEEERYKDSAIGLPTLETAAGILLDTRDILAEGLKALVRPPQLPEDAFWDEFVPSTAQDDSNRQRITLKAFTEDDVEQVLTERSLGSVIRTGHRLVKIEPERRRQTDLYLDGCMLAGAELSECQLQEAFLIGTYLHGARLPSAHLEGAHLGLADLEGAYVLACRLQFAHLSEANMRGIRAWEAHFRFANLNQTDLEDATLEHANFECAEMGGAHFERADLSDANLGGANLVGSDFRDASLAGANLQNVSGLHARFHETNLSGVNLQGADLSFADLRGADMKGARFDANTVLAFARFTEHPSDEFRRTNLQGANWWDARLCLDHHMDQAFVEFLGATFPKPDQPVAGNALPDTVSSQHETNCL